MKNNLKYLGLVFLLIIVIVFGALYSIDQKNMEEGKPVILSTWGKKYSPIEDKDALEIKKVINDYIVTSNEDETKRQNEKWFCADKIYLISMSDNIYTAYAWIYAASYINKNNGELLENNSLSQPHRFVIEKNDSSYDVIEVTVPRDGSLYQEDLKMYFPEKVVNEILKCESDGTIDSLQMDIQNQVAEFHK